MGIRVYHLIHGEFKGDRLNPSQANELDTEPYVYAAGIKTPDDAPDSKFNAQIPTECLPYCSPNGTRIFNHTNTELGITLTLLPNRAAFMKALESGERKFQGVIYELPAEKFTQSPRHDTQYICPEPILFSEMRKTVEINSLEDAMKLGLHVLFTKEPHTPENNQFYADIMNAPDFPQNLKSYVEGGTFIYENEQKGLQPLPFLSASPQPDSGASVNGQAPARKSSPPAP